MNIAFLLYVFYMWIYKRCNGKNFTTTTTSARCTKGEQNGARKKKLDALEVIVIELGLELDAPQVWTIDLLDLNVLGSWLPTTIAVLDWPKTQRGTKHKSRNKHHI